MTRLLETAERAKTGALGITAFLQDLTMDIGASDTVRITVPASTRRALVIGEFEYDVRTATGASYTQGGYIELYNNTDSIIYLDGKVISRGFDNLLDVASSPCASLAHMRSNAQGMYAAAFEKFPGTGRQHPLQPGRSVVVAVDAIDHRPFAPAGYALSGAGFEFRGSADVDNPSVPNMVSTACVRAHSTASPGRRGAP